MTNTIEEQSSKSTPASFKQVAINILGRLWATWGLLSFVVTFLIIFIPSMIAYLIPGSKGQDYFIAVSRIWMWTWIRLIGCPAKITGQENFRNGENYVVVFNHNALLDVPLSAPFVPGGNKTIAKASFAKVPIFGWFYKRGSVLIKRGDNKSRVKSFEAMKQVLRNNMHMCIYPEGTRNRSDEPLKPFYDGAFRLAIDAKKEVIPCLIFGTKNANPVNKTFFLWPTKLEMHFLPAVSSTNIKASDLKEKVFLIMTKHYQNTVI